MLHYFGYGSNMDSVSLRAKGVTPSDSTPGALPGWELCFNVHHWFRHEGGVGNIRPSDAEGARVLGVVHRFGDDELAKLDAVESYGVGYDRITVRVETREGPVDATAYVGIDSYLDDACLPTRRYLNILTRGAEAAGIDTDYVAALRNHPVHEPAPYPPFTHPDDAPRFTHADLLAKPTHTALLGALFDMEGARWQHDCLVGLIGRRDMTEFFVRRHDTSRGDETLSDILAGSISEAQRAYLNAYLHEYAHEYRYLGRYDYPSAPPHKEQP